MSSDDLTFDGSEVLETTSAATLDFVDSSAYPAASPAVKNSAELEAFLDDDDDDDIAETAELISEKRAPAAPSGWMSCLSCLPRVEQYFNVDTNDVRDRVMKIANPLELKDLLKYPPSSTVREGSFLSLIISNPDLYGPFWIAATLVFTIGVCSNVATWLAKPSVPKAEFEVAAAAAAAYDGDVTKLTGALTLVAIFAIGAPLALFALARFWGVAHLPGTADVESGLNQPLTAMTFVCLYGYSLIFLNVACVVMALPVFGFGWLGIAAGFLGCTASVVHELWPVVATITATNAFPVGKAPIYAGVIAAVNAVFCFTIKVFYF